MPNYKYGILKGSVEKGGRTLTFRIVRGLPNTWPPGGISEMAPEAGPGGLVQTRQTTAFVMNAPLLK